jgi:hypothetical protein
MELASTGIRRFGWNPEGRAGWERSDPRCLVFMIVRDGFTGVIRGPLPRRDNRAFLKKSRTASNYRRHLDITTWRTQKCRILSTLNISGIATPSGAQRQHTYGLEKPWQIMGRKRKSPGAPPLNMNLHGKSRSLCFDARSLVSILLTVSSCAAFAADWEAMNHTPAQIQVVGMHPAPLVQSNDKDGWAKVPAAIAKYNPVIYMPNAGKMGVADITVTGDGYLLISCNYENQGNRGGNWTAEVWDEKKFKTKGWHVLSGHEMEGELVKGDNRVQVVYSKQVHKGETLRVRCNKYDPPFPILLGGKAETAK